jgi:hypothetical protein
MMNFTNTDWVRCGSEWLWHEKAKWQVYEQVKWQTLRRAKNQTYDQVFDQIIPIRNIIIRQTRNEFY